LCIYILYEAQIEKENNLFKPRKAKASTEQLTVLPLFSPIIYRFSVSAVMRCYRIKWRKTDAVDGLVNETKCTALESVLCSMTLPVTETV
jgi:hypothetical protein